MVDAFTGAIALAFKTLEKPLSDLYTASSSGVKSLAKKWNAAGKRDALVQMISEAEKVRTIFSPTPIPLSSFYYPSRVRDYPPRQQSRFVKNLDELAPNKNILVLGTVGQGKSILMRYLCIEELRIGKKIPIFLELRTLESKDSVQSKIIEVLGSLGFDGIDKDIFTALLNHGCFVFFLDGFDELKRELAASVQGELTRLMKMAPKTRWVISSRPGSLSSHVSGIPNLHTVEIDPLADDDFDPFLKALNVNEEARNRLVGAILSSPGEIKGVLKTPLMLTLLNMTFGTSTHIPDTLHEFYESMFLFLVYRHDETKPGYIRQKITSLSNAELQDAFEYFCFLSKDCGVSLSEEDFTQCAKNASKLSDLKFTPEAFREDLSETVCLMQRDGIRTAFIHRSIQEFYTAFFIKHLGAEATVKSIYERIKGRALVSWHQELRFLEQIDKYRFIEYHRLPQINEFLTACEFKSNSKIGVSKAAFLRYLNTQPIISLKNNNTTQRGEKKRNYWVVVCSGEVNYTAFTAELGKLLPADGHLTETLKDSGFLRKDSGNEIVHIAKKLAAEEIDALLAKFRELVKRADRERTRLAKTLSERQENFRDILLRTK